MTADAPALPTFTVPADTAPTRLDVWLLAQLQAGGEVEDFSRARVQSLIKEGHVRLGAEVSANPAKKVRPGETFTVDVPALVASELVPEEIPLEIVFEDKHLLVINKPAGLTVHPAPGNYTGTLVHALLHHCAGVDGLSGINGEARPGIVHRLDKDTSGLLVVAKNDKAHRSLAKQFAAHSSHRVYLAVCRGVPAPQVGRIESLIGRHPTQRMKRAVLRPDNPGGKLAITHYMVKEAYGKAAALVELKLETGRTHQIRVHLSNKGHGLLGDPLYRAAPGLPGIDTARATEILQGLTGQALHAAELGFAHPVGGKWLQFNAPLPQTMVDLTNKLKAAAAG